MHNSAPHLIFCILINVPGHLPREFPHSSGLHCAAVLAFSFPRNSQCLGEPPPSTLAKNYNSKQTQISVFLSPPLATRPPAGVVGMSTWALGGRPCLLWKYSAPRKDTPGRESKSLPPSLGLSSALTGLLFLLFRTAEPQSSRNHPLCKKDCVQSRGDEELVRRIL